jgi:hypothetical protein
MNRLGGTLLAFAVAVGQPAGVAWASDFKELRRPEVVRAMLLSPERKAQVRCAIFLTAATPDESGIAADARKAFVAEVTRRLGADIGNEPLAAEQISQESIAYGAAMDLSVRQTAGGLRASRSICGAWAAALRKDDRPRIQTLLGPVPAAPITLPDAAQCLAAFLVDKGVRKTGNDLAADMIEPLERGLAKADTAIRSRFAEEEARYRAAPPNPATVEVMTLTCMPALASISDAP